MLDKSSNSCLFVLQVRRDPEQRVRVLLHGAGLQQPLAHLVRGPARRRDRLHLRPAAQRLSRLLWEGQEVVPTDDDLLGKLCKNWVREPPPGWGCLVAIEILVYTCVYYSILYIFNFQMMTCQIGPWKASLFFINENKHLTMRAPNS